MMKQISYPMHTIGLPKNYLSLLGLEMEGRLNVKINDTAYAPMQFNLRRRAITFYPIAEAETQTK